MIQVIDRAFDILEYIANRETGGVSLKEVAEHLSLNQATCANIIKSMTKRGYIEHIAPKKGFRLGPMATFLVGNFSLRPALVLAGRDIVEKLTIELNENALISVLHNNKRIIVYATTLDHDLNVRNNPDRNIYETATGRLLLAYLSAADQQSFIEYHGLPPENIWKGAQSDESLLDALKKIKEKAYVVTHTTSHVVGVAVPLWKGSEVVASVGSYLPESRFIPSVEKDMEKKLKEAAHTISARLLK